MRRASHEALTKVAVQRYHPLQTKEATILASALLASPENRTQHIQRAATSTIMTMLYDYPTLASAEDKAVQDMDRTSNWVARTTAWFVVVEFFPWIMHIPQRSDILRNSRMHSHINNQQVFEMEEGSLEARRRAFRDVSTIIQSCQNGSCTTCHRNVGGALLMYSKDTHRGASKFQRIVDRTP
jgi:hypothetical protein